jgi:hypothetical protein
MHPTNVFSRWARLTFVCCLVAGCAGSNGDSDRTEADTRFDENKALFGAIQQANRVTVYEGLPHQFNEKRQLEEERQNKDTVTIHGFSFYREPLEIPDPEQEKLRNLLGNEGSFLQWQGEKKCGGFHPDYCVEYHVGSAAYRFLICFGCHEVKVYGPESSLRCDIRGEAYQELQGLLAKHQKNRPPKEKG